MPLKDGIPGCREMAASLLETRVLMLTASNKHCATVGRVERRSYRIHAEYLGKEMLCCLGLSMAPR